MTPAATGELLKLTNVSKTFAGVTVLSGVDLDIQAGEVHALLGQNGSGKSTLIKVLAGYHSPDEGGRLVVNGTEVELPLTAGDPSDHGLAFVHQDLGLVDELSIMDNLSVGEYEMQGGWRIDWKRQADIVAASLEEFGVHDDVHVEVGRLSSPAKKALIAICRAVSRIRKQHATGVLVLDEPTVYLPRDEVQHLQAIVRRLAASGVGVLYVTHRLDELVGFADRATVLRDGRRVGEVDIAAEGTGGLVAMITGTAVDLGERRVPEARGDRDEVLSARGISGGRVRDVTFSAYEKEIVGLAGLVGMGQDDVLALIFGAESRSAGEVSIGGAVVPGNPTSAIANGIAFLPADRPRFSGAVTETVQENLSLPVLRKFLRGGRLRASQETRHVRALLDEYDVRPRTPSTPLARLSGGNQQKALLAKWVQTAPRVLLLDEPVQGVDVGAKAQLFDRLRELASSGCTLVIASSEYEDLALLCDRVLVFVDGKVDRVLSGSEVTKDQIAAACYGSQVAV
jgi:ribose transport system ATP-binding protein